MESIGFQAQKPYIASGKEAESSHELPLSSSRQELQAVDNVLHSFVTKLSGCAIKWFSDNQAVFTSFWWAVANRICKREP